MAFPSRLYMLAPPSIFSQEPSKKRPTGYETPAWSGSTGSRRIPGAFGVATYGAIRDLYMSQPDLYSAEDRGATAIVSLS